MIRGLFYPAEMGIRTSNGGMSMENDGKKGAQETGQVGRRAIDVFVNPGVTDIVLHVVFLHLILILALR